MQINGSVNPTGCTTGGQSGGNSWYNAFTVGTYGICWWTNASALTGGVDSISVKFVSNTGNMQFSAMTVSGVDTADIDLGSCGGLGSSATNNPTCGPTSALTVTDELVILMLGGTGAQTVSSYGNTGQTTPVNFTAMPTAPDMTTTHGHWGYAIVSHSDAVSTSATVSNSADWWASKINTFYLNAAPPASSQSSFTLMGVGH
jgi:hypothetical protein